MPIEVMARSRSQSAPRLTRDASRLITLAQALNRSGSRVEDIFWEAQLAEAIPKLLKAGQDARSKPRWTIWRRPMSALTRC